MSDFSKVGFALPDDQIQRLDDMAANWDEREASSVSRSAVAREALALGLAALETIDDEPTVRRLSTHDKQAIVRQALLDELRE